MRLRPTIRHLEYLQAVAEKLSFREAAKQCHVTQPALSTQIAQLEALLGVPLFERDRRRVVITTAGREVVDHARRVLNAIDGLADAARVLAEPLSGALRLGVIPTVAPYLLPGVLDSIRRSYPALHLLLREDQTDHLVEQIEEGKLDLLLLALEADLGDLSTLPLFQDPFVVALPVGHRLAKKERLRQAELVGEEVLLLEDGHCLRDQAWAVCQSAGARELGDFRATSLFTLAEMVANGLGITLLPAMAAPHMSTIRGLCVRPLVSRRVHRTIGLAWRRTSPRGAEFQELARHFRVDRGRS